MVENYLERFSLKSRSIIKKFADERGLDAEKVAHFMIINFLSIDKITKIPNHILEKCKVKQYSNDDGIIYGKGKGTPSFLKDHRKII